MTITYLVLAGLVIAYQVWVSVLLLKAKDTYSPKQLVVQFFLVWLLPFLGAVICHFFFKLTGTHEPPQEHQFIQASGFDCDNLTNHHIDHSL
ncbi:hypothetical protein [Thiobacillus sp.]|uniref:hypothetical protein n=1 Tax=Thiobacillus sp. TaxID=924 RepID=UPI001AD5957B|nr:hypothetical protein [Thiobacillus sp.]MBN8780781.1 hypothetical protein [Thiobacillus sp.]